MAVNVKWVKVYLILNLLNRINLIDTHYSLSWLWLLINLIVNHWPWVMTKRTEIYRFHKRIVWKKKYRVLHWAKLGADHLKVLFETQQNSKIAALHPFHLHLHNCTTKSSILETITDLMKWLSIYLKSIG